MAFRNTKRYIRHVEPTVLPPVLTDSKAQAIYRPKGVYIILGGASGIGLELARYLAADFQARLAIVGRSPLDSNKQQMLIDLAALGGEAIYISADITDLDSVQSAIGSTKQRWGELNGVVHSAVVLQDTMLSTMDEKIFNRVTYPKIQGSWNVAQATANENLDFIVFFSSIAGFAGAPGQANYAAAATFEDSFATYLSQQRHYPVKVINWGPWGSVGVAANDYHKELLSAQGLIPIDTNEGVNAVARVLQQSDPQIIAFKAQDKVLRQYGFSSRTSELSLLEAGSTSESDVSEVTPLEVQPDEDVGGVLRREFSELSGITIDDIDEDAEWIDMGIDSIKIMKMLESIESHWGVRIYPNELQEFPTLKSLSEYLTVLLKQEKSSSEGVDGSKQPVIPLEEITDVNIDLGPTYSPLEAGKFKKPLLYILSTPRAGSTLLRVMLMGSSSLFSPPELHLLPFESSKQRAEYLVENNQQFLAEGLIETLAELEGISADKAVQRMENIEQQDLSIKEVYAMLQDLAGDRIVVDKSPTYADDLATLSRAEHTSDEPLYIFLVRHPLSVIESFVRNRFDKLLGIDEDPWQYAQDLWFRYNSNLRSFLSTVPPERQCVIRYEDLVSQPEVVIKRLCSKWGIAFDEHMLNPYQGKRMTEGLHEHSMTIGDPNFGRHDSIDASLANAWRGELDKLTSLKPETLLLATQLGYVIEGQKDYPLLPSQKAFMNQFGDDPTWHIVQRFEQPSDFDVARYQQSLQLLVTRHTALRVSLEKRQDEWVQHINDEVNVCVDFVDLSSLDADTRKLRLAELESSLHQRLNINSAPLITSGVALLAGGEHCVILVLHHLISDGFTLRLINDEWVKYYNIEDEDKSIESGQVEREKAKYLACIDDAQLLNNSLNNKEYLDYWQQQIGAQHKSIEQYPRDFSKRQDDIASECSLVSEYDWSELGIDNKKSKALIFDYLSVALYDCIGEWAGESNPLIAHRLHRRNLEFNEHHFSTVAWLAGDVVLGMDVNLGSSEKIQSFQEKFRHIPMGGISYEILRNQGLLAAAHEVAAVRLNYQPEIAMLKDIESDVYLYESAEHERLYLLDIIVRVMNNQLKVIVRYSKNRHKLETIQDLVINWLGLTKKLISETNLSKKDPVLEKDVS